MPITFQCFILSLIQMNIMATYQLNRSVNSLLEFTFPKKVPFFTAVPFYIARASFIQIRHMNRSVCSLNAMGNATFPCRCFTYPSDDYELLIDSSQKFTFSVTAKKRLWKVPEVSTTCQPLMVKFYSDILLCKELKFSLHLQYSPAVSTRKVDDLKFITTVKIPLENSTTLIPCQHLCLSGIYRVALLNGDWIIQISELIKVQQRDIISINLPRPHIFPYCFDYLMITWTNLSCPVQNMEFKMRLFALPEGTNFEQSYYVEEYDIDLSEQALELPCYQFDIIYVQFCFEIVSVEKVTARFSEWARRCVYTENLRQVDGSWEAWSRWSTCSVSCGHGIRRRWRLCHSPVPENGGSPCEGRFVETVTCSRGNCSEVAATATVRNISCSCGCIIHNKAGRFFATPCTEGVTDWTLKPYGSILAVKLECNSETRRKLRLRIYRGKTKKELVYDSKNNPGLKNSMVFNSEDYYIISLLNSYNSTMIISSGFEINYEWNNENDVISSRTTSNPKDKCLFCHRNLSFLLVTGLFIILIIFTPPLICACISLLVIRKAQRKQSRHLGVQKSLEESRLDLNMIRSVQTDITDIKSNKTVATKRSIGIQLSASSTPRFPRYKGIFWSRSTQSLQVTPRNGEHSSLSFNTDHDLEYDYYEPAVLGSFLKPALDFYPEIDAEQLNDNSKLSCGAISKHDAYTQFDET